MSDLSEWVEKNKLLWTRVYDEVIAPKLKEEWKQREEAVRALLDENEVEKRALRLDLENLNRQNLELWGKLSIRDAKKSPVGSNAEDEATDLSIPANDHQQVSTGYAELSKKYEDLTQKVKYLEQKNNAVMKKNKDMKESVRAWQKYADRQSVKQKLRDEKSDADRHIETSIRIEEDVARSQQSSNSNMPKHARSPLTLASLGHSSPAPLLPLASLKTDSNRRSLSSRSNESEQAKSLRSHVTARALQPHLISDGHEYEAEELPLLLPLPENSVSMRDNRMTKDSHGIIVNSSQTTQDENAELLSKENRYHVTDSKDDVPEIVSERSLKRKRYQASPFAIYSGHPLDGTPAKPCKIKEEQQSSPPLLTDKLMRNETIDLDAPTPNVLRTPRHSERSRIVRPDSTGILRHQRSNSAPFSNEIKREDDESSMVTNEQQHHATASEMLTVTAAPNRATSEPSNAAKNVPNALALLDPNIPSYIDEPIDKRRKRGEERSPDGKRPLAKTNQSTRSTGKKPKRFTPTTARERYHQRIESSRSRVQPVLQGKVASDSRVDYVKTEQDLVSPTEIPTSPDLLSRDAPSTPVTARRLPDRTSPAENPLVWTMKIPMTRASARKSTPTRLHQDTNLRLKSLAELKLQDFKPNLAYNHGYSHAFSETVRKRGERLCLPGCTNPRCCGSTFRVLAEAQAPLSYVEEEAILEEYLGDAYDNMRLTQMAPEERKELILQARTRKIAKENGKHREMYERRRTPPGFWRVDFPNTQERIEDREKAVQQERAMVKERWLEAQRKGGRWVFRDE